MVHLGNKRGQLTIFMLLALLVIAGVILFFVLRDTETSFKDPDYPEEVNSLQSYVKECVDEQFDIAVKDIGLKGGYNNLPKESIVTEHFSVAYGYNKRDVLVSISEMENQISSFMEETLLLCVDGTRFSDLSIKTQDPSATTTIELNTVSSEISYPITAQKGNSSYIIEEFETSTDLPLGDMHSKAKKIVEKRAKSDYLDLNYFSESKYKIDVLPLGDGDFIYSIIGEEYKINKSYLTFNFGLKNE